jgi:hypothetical protein
VTAAIEAMLQHLSVFIAALGVAVAALTVLFTAGAILAAWLLYRQSKDHREQIEAFLDGARRQLAATEEQKALVIADLRGLAETIPQKAKERLEATITRIERAHASIPPHTQVVQNWFNAWREPDPRGPYRNIASEFNVPVGYPMYLHEIGKLIGLAAIASADPSEIVEKTAPALTQLTQEKLVGMQSRRLLDENFRLTSRGVEVLKAVARQFGP